MLRSGWIVIDNIRHVIDFQKIGSTLVDEFAARGDDDSIIPVQ